MRLKEYRFSENSLIRYLPHSIKQLLKMGRFWAQLCLDLPRCTVQLFVLRPRAEILLCIASPASIGGTELQVAKIGAFLMEQRRPVCILITGAFPSDKEHLFLARLKSRNIPYLYMGRLGPFFIRYTAYLLKQFQATSCHFFNPSSTSLIQAAKEANLKIFYWETGLPSPDPWWDPIRPFIQSIDCVVGISQTSLRQFCHLFPFKGQSAVCYSLIDPPVFPYKKKHASADELKIIYFGRIYHLKGIYVLLEAFRKLLLTHPFAQLTYVGEGPDKKNLLQQAVGLPIYLMNFEKKRSIYELLTDFDLFCLPSFSEGTPCSILEAMAVGLPIVSTKVGGIPELIEEGTSGLLVAPNDIMALTQALKLCAESPSLRQQLGARARLRYQNHFSSLENLSKICSL